jgi:hypothetical protein
LQDIPLEQRGRKQLSRQLLAPTRIVGPRPGFARGEQRRIRMPRVVKGVYCFGHNDRCVQCAEAYAEVDAEVDAEALTSSTALRKSAHVALGTPFGQLQLRSAIRARLHEAVAAVVHIEAHLHLSLRCRDI